MSSTSSRRTTIANHCPRVGQTMLTRRIAFDEYMDPRLVHDIEVGNNRSTVQKMEVSDLVATITSPAENQVPLAWEDIVFTRDGKIVHTHLDTPEEHARLVGMIEPALYRWLLAPGSKAIATPMLPIHSQAWLGPYTVAGGARRAYLLRMFPNLPRRWLQNMAELCHDASNLEDAYVKRIFLKEKMLVVPSGRDVVFISRNPQKTPLIIEDYAGGEIAIPEETHLIIIAHPGSRTTRTGAPYGVEWVVYTPWRTPNETEDIKSGSPRGENSKTGSVRPVRTTKDGGRQAPKQSRSRWANNATRNDAGRSNRGSDIHERLVDAESLVDTVLPSTDSSHQGESGIIDSGKDLSNSPDDKCIQPNDGVLEQAAK